MKVKYTTMIKTETRQQGVVKKMLRDCQKAGGDFYFGNKGACISFCSDGSCYIYGGKGKGDWIRADRTIKELLNIIVYDFNILLT